jgi:thiamine-phosphate pyrophosphorylase
LVQLRAKDLAVQAFLNLAQKALRITQPAGIPLLVNDNVEIALLSGAQGVHLGQTDMAYAQARSLLGPKAIIGLSLEDRNQWPQALQPSLDYVAASPVFSTPTKTDTAPALGLEGLAYLVAKSPIPVAAIGGISMENIGSIAKAGARWAAVVSAICAAPDPRAATAALAQAFSEGTKA